MPFSVSLTLIKGGRVWKKAFAIDNMHGRAYKLVQSVNGYFDRRWAQILVLEIPSIPAVKISGRP